MRKTILALLALLLATGAYAQVGSPPGISGAPPQLVGSTLTGQTNATGAVFTGATPFCFEGATDNAFETCIGITDPTAARLFTLPDISGTALISTTANEFDTSNSVWANTGKLVFEGSTANSIETTLQVTDPTGVDKTITFPNLTGQVWLGNTPNNNFSMIQGYSTSYITLNSDGAMILSANGGVYLPNYQDPPNLLAGDGINDYNAWGMPNLTTTAYKVDITIVDTTPTITAGSVHICGTIARSFPSTTVDRQACETVSIAGGAGSYQTVNSYYTVGFMKSTSVSVLDGGGDETITAVFNTDGNTIFNGNLVSHAKSTSTGNGINLSVGELYCGDLEFGCDLTIDSTYGYGLAAWSLLTVGLTSGPIDLVAGTEMLLDGPYHMVPGDSLYLIFNPTLDKWVEVSRSRHSEGLVLEGATSNTFQTTIAVTDPTADRTITLQDASGTVLMSTTANEFDTSNAFWVNTGALIFEGSTGNAYETAVNVLDPTEARTISFPDSNGIVEVRSQAATSGAPGNLYAMMVNGGYALDGTLTATPASLVTITLADPEADSAPTQSVLVCGYENATNKVLYVRSCETIAAVEGAVDSVNSYVEVEYIKGSGKAGDDADDTIAAEFKTGPVSIRSATAIADSAKTDITPSAAINGSSIALYCADAAGCDFQPGDPGSAADGKTLILMAKAGTTNIVVKDDDILVELDADADATLDAKDTLMLIWNDSESKWLQVGKQVVN